VGTPHRFISFRIIKIGANLKATSSGVKSHQSAQSATLACSDDEQDKSNLACKFFSLISSVDLHFFSESYDGNAAAKVKYVGTSHLLNSSRTNKTRAN